MSAAVEQVRAHLRRARDAKDFGHSANELTQAIDALEGVDILPAPNASPPIAKRLAGEIFEILERLAHQGPTIRNPAVLDRLREGSQSLLETGLTDYARLQALIGWINDRLPNGAAKRSAPNDAVQLLAWLYRPLTWARANITKYNTGRRRKLAELWRCKRDYEIQALASLKGLTDSQARESLQKYDREKQERIRSHESVQRVARQLVREELLRTASPSRRPTVDLSDLIDG